MKKSVSFGIKKGVPWCKNVSGNSLRKFSSWREMRNFLIEEEIAGISIEFEKEIYDLIDSCILQNWDITLHEKDNCFDVEVIINE